MILKGKKTEVVRALEYLRHRYPGQRAADVINQVRTEEGARELALAMSNPPLARRYVKISRNLYKII